jgi:hypothetical protein
MNPYVKGRWNRPQEVQTVNVIVIQVLQLILIPKVKLKTSLLVTNSRGLTLKPIYLSLVIKS